MMSSNLVKNVAMRRCALAVLAASLACGCVSPLFTRYQSPDESEPVVDYESYDDGPVFVGDLAIPWGMNLLKVESVGFATGLEGTGSDPPPGPVLDRLLAEMRSHDVDDPEKLLALPSTSLVLVRGYVPPGAQKGDRFDVEVYLPSGTKSTSLRGGWLMQSRLREIRLLGNAVRNGEVAARAGGPIHVDSLFEGTDDTVHKLRGRVLGGAIVQKARPMGLYVSDKNSSILTTAKIGAAINARFHSTYGGAKKGAANPTTDSYVELLPHPAYRHNLSRYLRVIRKIAVDENAAERADRLVSLQRRLVDPTTASQAAMELEAIGQEGIRVLRQGLQINDPEVRFYSAEALAYLDVSDAAEPLREAAHTRAFRWRALTALSTMDHVAAYDALVDLLNAVSAETRYGAFASLRVRNPGDRLVRGEPMADQFSYHVIATPGEPMVHFSRTKRPEVILFKHDLPIRPPQFLFAGKHIVIKGQPDGRIKLSRFTPGAEEKVRFCGPTLDELIRAIVDVGGGYGEVLDAVRTAQQQGDLHCRVVIDATPRNGRTYHREHDEPGDSAGPPLNVSNPVPDLFFNRLGDSDDDATPDKSADYPISDPPQRKRGFFGKLTSWLPN